MTCKNSGPDGLALIPPLSAPSLGAVTQTQPLSNLHSETHVHLDAESYSQVFTNTHTHASLPHTNTLQLSLNSALTFKGANLGSST